jgi:hypothetical protein
MIPRRLSLIGGILLAVSLPMLWADSSAENEADSAGSTVGPLAAAPVAASVVLSNLVQTYDGTAKQPTITTQPAGLRVGLTFEGATSAPVGAGCYRVSATVLDPGYVGTSTGTFTINRATPVLNWSEPFAITYGAALTSTQLNAAADVPGTITYDPPAGTVLNAGRQQLLAAVFTPSDTANFNTVSSVTDITVNKAIAVVTLAGLSQPYDGTPAAVAPRTLPANLKVAVEYDETADAPVFPGEHHITAIVDDANYVGSTFEAMNITITALVRHAPRLAGMIDGSLQVLSAENVVLRGNAWISGDLLVPGTPTLALHGLPMIVGTYDASGLDLPANYTVSIEDGFIIRYLVRRIDPLILPVVAPPSTPSGTRDVTMTAANPDAGDFTTIRDLTADNIVGEIAVPAGKYGVLTASGGGGFVLGHGGATAPDVYHVQRLILTNGAHLRIAGPVLLVLANGITVSGVLGDVDHPEWLTLAVAAGGVTIQPDSRLYGNVLAPEGEVTIERGAAIVGEVASDRLTIKQDGVLAEPRS